MGYTCMKSSNSYHGQKPLSQELGSKRVSKQANGDSEDDNDDADDDLTSEFLT